MDKIRNSTFRIGDRVEYFTYQISKRADDLEERIANYLTSQQINYHWSKRDNGNRGIDFIISTVTDVMYMDAIAQGVNGSIIEKLPTKCYKYIIKYGLTGKDIYMLLPYCNINQVVADHLELLEKALNCNIHILDWNDFTYIINGGTYKIRKPYVVGKNGVARKTPNDMILNKFFKYNKS